MGGLDYRVAIVFWYFVKNCLLVSGDIQQNVHSGIFMGHLAAMSESGMTNT